jgi:hypothetical protein
MDMDFKAWKADALAQGDWKQVLDYERSTTRLPKLLKIWSMVPPDQRQELLESNWSVCDGNIWRYRKEVVSMFKSVGYCGDAPRPDKPTRLYRGTAHSAWCRGVSWTGDIHTARFFADGGRLGPMGGFVYTVVAQPDVILGRFNDREEDEYVLDIDLLPRLHMLEVVQRGEGMRNSTESPQGV